MILSSMLITNALTIFIIEAQLPPIAPIPGIKLGLANVVTLFAKIHILRIVLGSIFTGQTISFMYSISGGICCLLVMMLCRKLISKDFIWLAGIFSAIAHIIGQLAVAMLVLGTVSVLYYAPIVLVSSIVTGFFTGLCVQFLLKKHEKTFCNMLKK